MKKLLTLFLCAVLLCGCAQEGEVHTISNYDSESNVSVTLPQVSDTSETAEMTGDFSVKEKVYDYEGNNIAILDVTNNTNKDLAVTITCTYLDGEGKELGSDTQSFGQYSAGYQNYHLFNPGFAFERVSYQLEVEEPTEPMYAKNITFVVYGLVESKKHIFDENGNIVWHPALYSKQSFSNGNDIDVEIGFHWIFFNEKDEVLTIVSKPYPQPYMVNPIHPEVDSTFSGWNDWPIYINEDVIFGHGDLDLPEKYQGKITALACIYSVAPYAGPIYP